MIISASFVYLGHVLQLCGIGSAILILAHCGMKLSFIPVNLTSIHKPQHMLIWRHVKNYH